jgi:hypothetical protein
LSRKRKGSVNRARRAAALRPLRYDSVCANADPHHGRPLSRDPRSSPQIPRCGWPRLRPLGARVEGRGWRLTPVLPDLCPAEAPGLRGMASFGLRDRNLVPSATSADYHHLSPKASGAFRPRMVPHRTR